MSWESYRFGYEEINLADLVQISNVRFPAAGIDNDAGCKSAGYALDKWSRFVIVERSDPDGRVSMYRHGATAGDPKSIPELWLDAMSESERERYSYSPLANPFYAKDERPYFKDPVPLAFDPEESIRNGSDKPEQEEGVTLREIWRDPLARTLWLAIKARHITSQYFRGACICQAEWIRQKPPRTSEDLHLSTGEGTCAIFFNAQVYPYVVRCLIDERRWPYFIPAGVPTRPLAWTRTAERAA